MEHYLKMIDGVVETEVGYANGNTGSPTYEDVCTDKTGFAETVRVVYNPRKIALRSLLEVYFMAIDPTSVNHQGEDSGTQYRTGVYYAAPADEQTIAHVFDEERKKANGSLAVECLPLKNFFRAEEYHQDYLGKNPGGYCHIPKSLFEYAHNYRQGEHKRGEKG